MDSNILVKYDISGEFFEGYFYDIVFEYDKCSNIITLENTPNDSDIFLKEINGKVVSMQYRGISKIDGLKIFILNSSTIRREYKLKELFK
jgi:hypothetical protein